MASNSGRRSGSSDRSKRKRVVIGAEETVRVRYDKDAPRVESERRSTARKQKPSRTHGARSGGGSRPAARAGKRLATAKRDERTRRQTLIRVRRAGLVAAAVAAVALVVWSLGALLNAPLFRVAKVEVEGVRHLTSSQVVRLAAVPRDATLLRLPAAAIERRIEADPWVIDATVARDFPSTLRIVVQERTPAAVVDAGGTSLWVVSRDGVWLAERSAEDTGLAVVRDVADLEPAAGDPVKRREVSNALAVLKGLSPELREQVRVISAPSIDQTALITESDVEIFVGESTDIAEKDVIAREILRNEKGKVVYINVRVVDKPTWRGL